MPVDSGWQRLELPCQSRTGQISGIVFQLVPKFIEGNVRPVEVFQDTDSALSAQLLGRVHDQHRAILAPALGGPQGMTLRIILSLQLSFRRHVNLVPQL